MQKIKQIITPLSPARIGIMNILLVLWAFSTAQSQVIYKTYPKGNQASSISVYNNGANFLINTCTDSSRKATYLWIDGQGNLLDTQADFTGSCGQYRYNTDYYLLTDAIGAEPNRDVRLTQKNRIGGVVLQKTYNFPMDNFGQVVTKTKYGDFIITYNVDNSCVLFVSRCVALMLFYLSVGGCVHFS